MSTSKRVNLMNSEEFKNENSCALFKGPPLSSIQTGEKNIKKRHRKIMYKLEMVFQPENH